MRQQEWATDQIEVVVSGFLTTRHRLETPAGTLGEITVSAFGRHAFFRGADGRELVMYQPRWWKGEYQLREGQAVLGTAWPRGFFSHQIIVEFAGQTHTLEPTSFWKRGWQLVDEAGGRLLGIEPRGVFRRGARLAILGEIDLALLAFSYYLVHKRWEAEHAAVAAAAH